MLARLPWTPPAAVALPKVVRINKDRRAHIVRVVTAILARGEPTRFAFEATCRHAVRSRLCLAGWRWSDADDMASDIVATALKRLGAQRPTWDEGQPEYIQLGAGTRIERTRCIRCRSKLPEGHWKFCSQLCAGAHFDNQTRIQCAEESTAYNLVVTRLTAWKRADAIA